MCTNGHLNIREEFELDLIEARKYAKFLNEQDLHTLHFFFGGKINFEVIDFLLKKFSRKSRETNNYFAHKIFNANHYHLLASWCVFG
jgi:hypothetical protein